MNESEELMRDGVTRRGFVTGVGALGVGIAGASLLAGCGSGGRTISVGTASPTPAPLNDFDILNFALNLEYLEAEFYLRAATGSGIPSANIGSNPGTVTGGSKVPFATPAIAAYAAEIAQDELKHVQYLRSAITAFGGTPVDRPTIDLTNSFNAAASAAGLGSSFNPFDNEDDFVVGAFTFEDVGVSAYSGAAPSISNATVLAAAAGILGTEAYHAGEIRTILANLGGSALAAANAISNLRASAGGGGETTVSTSTVVAADSNSIAYARTPSQVLHIVYLTPGGTPASGGFFPKGLNGRISVAS